jgi:RecA/RadA recombinase
MNHILKAMAAKPKKKKHHYLNTGSTMLNLGMSNGAFKGIRCGSYVMFVGDSGSGKSMLVHTCLAEAANDPFFDEYEFIYDGPEQGNKMDYVKFFGKKAARRIRSPSFTETPFSTTIQEHYYNMHHELDQGSPIIYVTDSMDALTAEQDEEKFDETMAAYAKRRDGKKGKDPAGSYGTAKAKANSDNIRLILPRLITTGSIWLCINQTRENLGFGFDKKTRSGGKAQKFYADIEVWMSRVKKLTKKVLNKDRAIGIISECHIKKNRYTGNEPKVQIPIYRSVGLDDLESCFMFMLEEGGIKKVANSFVWKDADLKICGVQDFIQALEENDLENDFRKACQQRWIEIEEGCIVPRKKRYA